MNQASNNIQEPLINNENLQLNLDEISLPVLSQNNLDDEANQKISIPPPFTNDEINQNINDEMNNNNSIPPTPFANNDINQNMINYYNNNNQKNNEMNQNLGINIQNNQNVNNNIQNIQNFNSNLNLINDNLQNNQNFNSNLQYNQPINNNTFNNIQMDDQVYFQQNQLFINMQRKNDCRESCRRADLTIACTIGGLFGFITFIVVLILYLDGYFRFLY